MDSDRYRKEGEAAEEAKKENESRFNEVLKTAQKIRTSNQENSDKLIITISTAGLGFIVGFINKTPSSGIDGSWMINLSLVFFFLSIISVLMSFYVSNTCVDDFEIEMYEHYGLDLINELEFTDSYKKTKYLGKRKYFTSRRLASWFNIASPSSLFFALLFLVLFYLCSFSINKTKTENLNTNQYQGILP